MAELPLDELGPVYGQIRSGEEPAYVVLGIDPENKKKLNIVNVGRCGLAHMRRFLADDQIMFGAFRCFACGAGIRQQKLVAFVWKGPTVGLQMRMKAQNVRAPVVAWFEGATEMEITAEDLTEEKIAEKLNAGRAGFKPTHYEFGTGNAEDLEYDEIAALEEARRAKEEADRIAAEEAARIAAAEAAEAERLRLIEEERQRRLRLLPPRAEGKAKRIAREPVIEGFDLGELTTLFAAEALADVEDPLAWVVCHVRDDEPKKVKVVATGAGGLEELVSKLDDGEVQFGAFRAAAIERKGAKLSIRSKLVTFWWSGSAVTTKIKRDNTELRSALSKYFTAPTLELRVNGDRADLSEARVVPELRKHVGATEFKFGEYCRDSQADDYVAQLAALDISADEAAAANGGAAAAAGGAGAGGAKGGAGAAPRRASDGDDETW